MVTDETDIPVDIGALARAHGRAAIEVMVEIMTCADAPAGARLSAARALLDRGWGRATAQPAEEVSRPEPVTRIERVIVYPKRREAEEASRSSAPREEPSCAPSQAFQDQWPGEDRQLAPPAVGAFSEFTNLVWDG